MFLRQREDAAGAGKAGGGDGVAVAIDIDVTAVDRIAVAIPQIAVGAGPGAVLKSAQGVACSPLRCQVVGELDLAVLLLLVLQAARAIDHDVGTQSVAVGMRASDRGVGGTGSAAGFGRSDKRIGLAVGVQAVGTQPPGQIAKFVADHCTGLCALELLLGAVEIEILTATLQLGPGLQLLWHTGADLDHRAHRVSRVGGRERAVHDIDTFDFFRRYQCPARRCAGVVVADQR